MRGRVTRHAGQAAEMTAFKNVAAFCGFLSFLCHDSHSAPAAISRRALLYRRIESRSCITPSAAPAIFHQLPCRAVDVSCRPSRRGDDLHIFGGGR